MDDKWGKGNIVFRRPVPVDVQTQENISVKQLNANSMNSSIHTKPKKSSTLSSQEMLQQMSESKHAPGIRKAGCPSCEPDSAATYADGMMIRTT